MSAAGPVVSIVDDDPSMLRALRRLLRSAGLTVNSFASAEEYLRSDRYSGPGCLVLDVHMPDQGGLDLQAQLRAADIRVPIVFITGYGEISSSVKAMKAGAVDFLPKPFADADLLDAVREALDRDRKAREQMTELRSIQQRFDTLTPREKQVFHLVVAGTLNKQIALQLGVTEKTVKVHRGRVMEKMQVSLSGRPGKGRRKVTQRQTGELTHMGPRSNRPSSACGPKVQ